MSQKQKGSIRQSGCNRKLQILDLFSGIGGFSLGLERAGMETIAFCEIEKFPRRVLRKHWPDVPIFKDVRELHAKDLPKAVDVICGGYPCQPFSVAGKRRGKKDDRHLWPEMFRLVRECRPTFVICENVAGHVTMGLDTVLSDLEGEGYTCWAFIIPACAVNAIHRRDRLWIVAHTRDCWGWDREQESSGENGTWREEKVGSCNANEIAGSGPASRTMANPQHHGHPASQEQGEDNQDARKGKERQEPTEQSKGVHIPPVMADSDSPRLQGVTECQGNEKMRSESSNQQFAGCHRSHLCGSGQSSSECGICSGNDGLPLWLVECLAEPDASPVIRKSDILKNNSAMIKALGNTIVPKIPEVIGRAILAQYSRTR